MIPSEGLKKMKARIFERGARNKLFLLLSFLLGALVCLVPASKAQVSQGAIAGNVQDSSGALVPNAQLTVTSAETGVSYKTSSSSAGSYHFVNLNIGT